MKHYNATLIRQSRGGGAEFCELNSRGTPSHRAREVRLFDVLGRVRRPLTLWSER